MKIEQKRSNSSPKQNPDRKTQTNCEREREREREREKNLSYKTTHGEKFSQIPQTQKSLVSQIKKQKRETEEKGERREC